MLLGSFLKEYNRRKDQKDSFRQICRENGLSYKKVQPYLKQLGFTFDQKIKEYVLAPENEPEREEIMQLDLKSFNAAYKQRQQKEDIAADQQTQADQAESLQLESSDHVQRQSGANISELMAAQLFDIVDLLQQINGKLPAADQIAAAVQQPDPVHEAPLAFEIHRISQQLKARKTINISSTCAGWLDSYSTTKGFHIGDLVTLAVMQLKERIDPENE
jgi:hypothetical protein